MKKIRERYDIFKSTINNKLLLAVLDGAVKGLSTGLMLLKIMLPVYFLVVLIKYSPVMPWLQQACAPAMKIFNLPADAVVPMVTGIFTDEYGVVAALGSFDFTMAATTTIAMFALTAHSIPVEAAVARKIGLPPMKFVAFRMVMAIFMALFIGWMGGVFL